MSEAFLWATDPDTGEEITIRYSDLDKETVRSFIKPVGGFIFPADLFTMSDLPSVPFYVEDWLPKRGKSMLYGPAKGGKSFTCLQLARCIGSGEPFLGLETTKASVLYIQFELGEEILQERLRSSGFEYPNVWVGTTFSMKIDTEAGQSMLWRAMEAVEPQVLILDPWYKAIIGDENEGVEIRKTLDFLDSVIESFECSIFLIHHSGKDETKRGRGTTAVEDWVDSYISLRKVSKSGEQLRIKLNPVFLRHAPLPDSPIEAQLGEDFEFHVVEKKTTVKEDILEFLKEKKGSLTPAVSPEMILSNDIGSNTSVYEALKELLEEEKIEKKGRGLYEFKEN